ncbi:hypothetical protein Q427_11930 [Halomonas sp. BC04]|nr:hypothetical protein Q427_11930 [Halomonas sp. BC04]
MFIPASLKVLEMSISKLGCKENHQLAWNMILVGILSRRASEMCVAVTLLNLGSKLLHGQ